MLPFWVSFGAWVAATVVPALVGLALVVFAGRAAGPRYAAAFALGIFFWFFVDTIQGSSDLDVNFGFTGGVDQLAMVLLFVFGLLAFFYADARLLEPGASGASLGLAVPILAALAVGIHGFGEGSAFGSTASQTSSTAILDAFGGTTAGVAYSLHKMLEPMMAGAVYVGLTGATGSGRTVRDLGILTLLFSLPSLVGAATGYFLAYDASYGFGLGTGTSIYVALRLGRQISPISGSGRREVLLTGAAIALGLILIYGAALFHS